MFYVVLSYWLGMPGALTWACTACGESPQTVLKQKTVLWLDLPLWFVLLLQDGPQQ